MHVTVGSKWPYYLWSGTYASCHQREITSVMTLDGNQSVPFCICRCKTCGVDTLYLPLLPTPPTQTWRAALVLLLTIVPFYTAVVQWYQLCPGCLVCTSEMYQGDDCERGKQVLRGPQDGNVSLVKRGGGGPSRHRTPQLFSFMTQNVWRGGNGELAFLYKSGLTLTRGQNKKRSPRWIWVKGGVRRVGSFQRCQKRWTTLACARLVSRLQQDLRWQECSISAAITCSLTSSESVQSEENTWRWGQTIFLAEVGPILFPEPNNKVESNHNWEKKNITKDQIGPAVQLGLCGDTAWTGDAHFRAVSPTISQVERVTAGDEISSSAPMRYQEQCTWNL